MNPRHPPSRFDDPSLSLYWYLVPLAVMLGLLGLLLSVVLLQMDAPPGPSRPAAQAPSGLSEEFPIAVDGLEPGAVHGASTEAAAPLASAARQQRLATPSTTLQESDHAPTF